MRDANIQILNAEIKFTGVEKKTLIWKRHFPVNLKASHWHQFRKR